MMEKRSFCCLPCGECRPARHRGGKYNRVVQRRVGLGGSPELELIKIDSFRGGDELERCCCRCGQALVHGANYLPAAARLPRPPPALTPAQGQILEKIDQGPVAPAGAFDPPGSSLLEPRREKQPERRGLGQRWGVPSPGVLPGLQSIFCI